ncbi:MAG: response regulator [Candidatus Melainabacteria bacterium]|nr:MAG: response regulator [Candidatus Melainabacteria bacterium]
MQTMTCNDTGKRGLKFLVVDDDQTIRKIMQIQLKIFGLRVDVAHDGVQAVQLVLGCRYDVIFMDIQMPNMNGILAAETIRSHELEHGHAPAYIIATTAGGATPEQCFDAGMNDYLMKPVGFTKVVDVLYQLLFERHSRDKFERELPKCGCCTSCI